MNMRFPKKVRPVRLVTALFYRSKIFGAHYCPICRHRPGRFLARQKSGESKLIEALTGVGSSAKHHECPWCGCLDRERHVFLYMQAFDHTRELSGKKVLHFAPERRLSEEIRKAGPLVYIKCDLFPQSRDVVRVDMLDMPYEDETFDLVIANHVLEHLSDDSRGVREVFRVLRRGGYAILQTPYCLRLNRTWEDDGIVTDEARLQAYGQLDHVRLYGKDIFARIEQSGLVACVASHAELLEGIDPDLVGVNPDEPFFLFHRPI